MSADHQVTTSSLFGDATLYGLPRVVSMISSVILLPLYTRYFHVAEYGVIENLNILAVLLTWIFSLALPSSIARFYILADSELDRVRILTSAAVATAVLSTLALVTMAMLAGWLGQLLLHREGGDSRLLIMLATAWMATNLQLGLYQSVFQARFQRREYLVSTLGSVVLSVAITFICLVLLGLGLLSVFLGPTLGCGILVVYSLRKVASELKIAAFHAPTLRQLLAFSLPLIPAALGILVIRSSDRYFITLLLPDSLHQVGLYSTAEKILGPLTLLGAAFSLAWSPFAMAASSQENFRALYLSAFKYYVALTSLLLVALCAAAPFLLRVLATPPYYGSSIYMPPLGLYLALNSLYLVGGIGFMLRNRTGLLVPMVLTAALLNTVLNFLWIPRYGVSGAAWATVVAFLAYNVMVYRVGERLHPVGFPLGGALAVYALAVTAAYLALLMPRFGLLFVGGHFGILAAAGFLDLRVLRKGWRIFLVRQ